MRIVQVMPEFGLAGAEIMCENLTYQLQKLGHEVTVISMYNFHSAITERLEKSGVEVRYMNKKSGIDFSQILKMKKLFKEIRPDVVHTHRYCAQYAIPAAILAGVKRRVHTVHNIAQKENITMARKLNKFFFKFCSLVPVALSDLIRNSIVEEYGFEDEKIPVIFNGIDLLKCVPKEEYSITGNFKILHIGRFSEQKNHIGLIKAFHEFYKSHSDSELWLIGDGEKRPEIEQYVNENGMASCVKFLGLQSNVYGFLQEADIFVLPSNYEGIPITLIEAMGTGLPIVATNVGGVSDMLKNGENAIIIKNDIDEIVKSFEDYYNDKQKRETYGKKAKERAIAFSAETMAEKYAELYKK